MLDHVDRNQRKRRLANASLKSGSMAASGTSRGGAPSGGPAWSWSVIVRDQPQPPAWRGDGADLAQCKARFKTAWLECIARLNEDDIAAARRAEQDK